MDRPILIQGAMDVETDYLVSSLNEVESVVLGGFHFWTGTFGRHQLVVSRTDVGIARCAAATALALREFQPTLVINQGIAGAHAEELEVGDIIVGGTCVAIHNTETTLLQAGEGSRPFAWQLHPRGHNVPDTTPFLGDAHWSNIFLQGDWPQRKRLGCIGSGDVFNREYDRIQWLHEQLGTDCEDMESVAAYEMCHRTQTPCLGLRIISNNERTNAPYHREVGVMLQKFILTVLSEQ